MIDAQRLAAEDPMFVRYATVVMDKLTGYGAEEWIYLLWKSYTREETPEQFIKKWEEGKLT